MLDRPAEVPAVKWYPSIIMELSCIVYELTGLDDVDDPDDAYRVLPEATEPMAARILLAEQGVELSAKAMDGWETFTTAIRALARDAVVAAVHGDWDSESYVAVLRAVCSDDFVGDAVVRFLLIAAGDAIAAHPG